MKYLYITLIIGVAMLTHSCEKCELIDQDIVEPVIDTTMACEGVFYINKAISDSPDVQFFFNELDKPIPTSFSFTERDGPYGVASSVFLIESNFSAYDSLNKQYVFEYYHRSTGPVSILFHHYDIATNVSTFTAPMNDYASPVFLNGRLYAIKLEPVNQSVFYQIIEINPLNGQELGLVDSGFITINSPCTVESMSSTTDGVELLYFLSGTNLIELNINNQVAKHIDLDPSFHPIDNLVQFFGIEYQKEGQLIALRNHSDNVSPTTTDLVSIELMPNSANLTQVLDISANLPAVQDGVINLEFYSTTYDPCDHIYYFTELEGNMPFTTNLFEIDLDDPTLKFQTVPEYWYGIESVLR